MRMLNVLRSYFGKSPILSHKPVEVDRYYYGRDAEGLVFRAKIPDYDLCFLGSIWLPVRGSDTEHAKWEHVALISNGVKNALNAVRNSVEETCAYSIKSFAD